MSPPDRIANGSRKPQVQQNSQLDRCGQERCSRNRGHEHTTDHARVMKKQSNSCSAEGFLSERLDGDACTPKTMSASMPIDVEGGSSFEHVKLKFSGSSCPGCTSKISKVLESMPCVFNLQMNTILLQAEFDLDLTKSSIHEVSQRVRSATGRSCEGIGNGWKDLALEVPSKAKDVADCILPTGVKDIVRLSKSSISVKYDPKVIGARQLLKALNADLDGPISLAPLISDEEVPAHIRKTAYKTIISSVLTLPILILAWAPLPEHKIIYGALSFAFATIVQFFVAGPFYPKVMRSLFLARVIDMDLLIVLSTSIGYVFSVMSFVCEIEGIDLASGVYFETSSLLITLIMVGKCISDLACHRAIKSGSVKSLQPRSALLVSTSDLNNGTVLKIDARLLQSGDIFRVNHASSTVTDGIIISGESTFDESIVTGEAKLLEKTIGSPVIAGSINQGDAVLVQLTRLPGENTIDDIAEMVDEVTRSKPQIQQTVDRIAGWFVPVILILAMMTLVIWLSVGTFVRKQPTGSTISLAITYAISVLIVSCPCAMVMAVPMVLLVQSKVAAKSGLILRSAEALWVARRTTRVIFDKTGTLTESCLSVVREEFFGPRSSIDSMVLALAGHSEHPVSDAVAKHLEDAGVEPCLVTLNSSTIGQGVEGIWNGEVVRMGNARWLGVEALGPVQTLISQNLTVMCVTQGSRLMGAFGLEATLRQDAKTVVARLIERGISVSIMSGDEIGAVQKVAVELGVPCENVEARCTPQAKQQHVKKLMQNHQETVIFCGDGINDAAALAQASVGILIGNGTTVPQRTADAVLIRPSLFSILTLIDMSRTSRRQITCNFAWAFIYNFLAILLAAGAFVNIRLPPEYAGLGEAVSILPIVLVPMHLRWRQGSSRHGSSFLEPS